jgi:hypothetical protein
VEASAYLLARTEVRGEDECWPWLLSVGSHGFGQAWNGETVVLVLHEYEPVVA